MKHLKNFGNFLLNAIFTLIAFVLIVQFAPISISNLFLNPIAVVKGLQQIQEKEYKKEEEKVEQNFKNALKKKKDAIFDANAPYFGNKDAKTQVVIFFDYKCGYCGALANNVANVMKDEKYSQNVKFIIKDFPILSPASKMLAVASLKAFEVAPDKFFEVHEALFKSGSDEKTIIATIKLITGKDINLTDTKKQEEQISKNLDLGQEIGIRGTPAMIIGDEFIGGLMSEEQLKVKLDALLSR